MSGLHDAFEFRRLLAEVADKAKGMPGGRHHLTQDKKGYALAVGGEQAKREHDFRVAIGKYLKARDCGSADNKAAWKQHIMQVFEDYLAKQKP